MLFNNLVSLSALILTAAANPVPGPIERIDHHRGPTMAEEDKTLLLSIFNDARAKRGANPLTWYEDRRSYAEVWTNQMCSDMFDDKPILHSNGSMPGPEYGETMSSGRPREGDDPVIILTSGWLEGESNWPNGSPESYEDYTQIVWKETTGVACGMTPCPQFRRYRWAMVCQFNPPGNVEGQYERNVGDRVAA